MVGDDLKYSLTDETIYQKFEEMFSPNIKKDGVTVTAKSSGSNYLVHYLGNWPPDFPEYLHANFMK